MRQPIIWHLLVNGRYPRNRDTAVIEMLDEVMLKEAGPAHSLLVRRMAKEGASILVKATVDSVDKDTSRYTKDGVSHVMQDADNLVSVIEYNVNLLIEEMLKAAGAHYHLIGDANSVEAIKEAVRDGFEMTRHI